MCCLSLSGLLWLKYHIRGELYKQQVFTSHGSGGQEAQDQGTGFLVHRWLFSCGVLTGWKEEGDFRGVPLYKGTNSIREGSTSRPIHQIPKTPPPNTTTLRNRLQRVNVGWEGRRTNMPTVAVANFSKLVNWLWLLRLGIFDHLCLCPELQC